MSESYEVIWNGAHEGANHDLLFAEQHPVVTPAPPIRPRGVVHEERSRRDAATLGALLSIASMTMGEAAERLQWTSDRVHFALSYLYTLSNVPKKVGVRRNAKGRWCNVYRMVPVGVNR